MSASLQRLASLGVSILFALWSAISAQGYAFNEVVPDPRQPAGFSGSSACPIPSHQVFGAAIAFRAAFFRPGQTSVANIVQQGALDGSAVKGSWPPIQKEFRHVERWKSLIPV